MTDGGKHVNNDGEKDNLRDIYREIIEELMSKRDQATDHERSRIWHAAVTSVCASRDYDLERTD